MDTAKHNFQIFLQFLIDIAKKTLFWCIGVDRIIENDEWLDTLFDVIIAYISKNCFITLKFIIINHTKNLYYTLFLGCS